MGVIPNPKMAFIFPISCILALTFPILIKYFPKCVGKGSFPKSQIKSLYVYGRFTFERIHNTKEQIHFYERVENHKAKERLFGAFK